MRMQCGCYSSTVFKLALLMVRIVIRECTTATRNAKEVSIESVFLEFSGNADNIFSLKMSSPQISSFTTGTSEPLFSTTILGSSEKLCQERLLRKPQANIIQGVCPNLVSHRHQRNVRAFLKC